MCYFNCSTLLFAMSKKCLNGDDLVRKAGSVFVSVSLPASVQQIQRADSYFSEWGATAAAIGAENHIEVSTEEVPPETIPTAEELLEAYLPQHIEASRWFFYITPGAKSRVFDGTIFVYHNPSPPFWNLYRLAKGIFRNLGIRLAKSAGTWEAHIPISVLTDKVFVESGLAGVDEPYATENEDRI